ncbi:MAG: signal peptidase II [Deltaproteobacteria bacterium]|nr:signal peptidase II [Deltaproteobacteria bacterium]
MKRRFLLIGILFAVSLALDQGTKQLARARLRAQPAVQVIEGYLDLEYHENPGMAFGLARQIPGARYLLIGVGLAALFFVWRLVRSVERHQRAADVAFALVASGAIGNMVDRIYIGRVVDFVVMHWQRKAVWPAYNVADVALVIGVGLLVIVLGRKPVPAKAQPRSRRSK